MENHHVFMDNHHVFMGKSPWFGVSHSYPQDFSAPRQALKKAKAKVQLDKDLDWGPRAVLPRFGGKGYP